MVQKNKKAVLLGFLLVLSTFLIPATIMVSGQASTQPIHFSMTLTTPSTNPSRQAWSEVIQNNLISVGIDNDRLVTDIKETVDRTERLGYVGEWQRLIHDESPSVVLMYTEEVVAFDPTALQKAPFEDLHYPLWPVPHQWKLNPETQQTTITVAQTGPAPEEGLNPYLSTSYYDLTVFGAVFW